MASFIAVRTKDSTVYVNTDHIVSITEDTDDESAIIQIAGGATVNTIYNIQMIHDLLGDQITAYPEESDDDSDDDE